MPHQQYLGYSAKGLNIEIETLLHTKKNLQIKKYSINENDNKTNQIIA